MNRQYRGSPAIGGAIFGGGWRRCLRAAKDPAPIEPSKMPRRRNDGLDAGALELGSFCRNGVYPDAAAATGSESDVPDTLANRVALHPRSQTTRPCGAPGVVLRQEALARQPCPSAGPCSPAWRANSRVVHNSCGIAQFLRLAAGQRHQPCAAMPLAVGVFRRAAGMIAAVRRRGRNRNFYVTGWPVRRRSRCLRPFCGTILT